jgi:hypothetical protein
MESAGATAPGQGLGLQSGIILDPRFPLGHRTMGCVGLVMAA